MVQQDRTVVVGVDGSTEALEAARFAAGEADVRGATLVIAHAVALPPLAVPHPPAFISRRSEDGNRILHETQLQLPAAPSRNVRLVLEVTSPVMLLTQLSQQADLVVVGHRRTGLEKLLMGSVSRPVAQWAQCPVVIVPRGWTAWSAGGEPVVVALDGKSAAQAALDVAFTSAGRLKVELLVLYAAEPSPLQFLMDKDKAGIAEIIAGAKQDHPDVVVRTVRVEAAAARAIIAVASAASLLVVGRPHGEEHFGAWTQSVANTVLRQVHCPVAVVSDVSTPAADELTWSPEPETVH